MRRYALLTLAALFLVGCQDSVLIEDVPPPNFDFSDATSDPVGNGYVAFLPPIRPQPDAFAGEFNPFAVPTVAVYLLPSNPGTGCRPDGSMLINANLGPVTIPDGLQEFQVSWDTGPENEVESGNVYRICVSAFGQEVAWRDVVAQDDNADNRSTARDPTWAFNNGRSVPISFHISQGLSCTLGNNIDCTEFLFQPGVAQVATCDDGLCGGAAQPNTFSEPTLVRIQLLQCERDPLSGRITNLGVETDVPLYPGCLEVEALNVETVDIPVTAPFIAGACIDVSPDQTGSLDHRQFDLLQLHHARTETDGSVVVEALPQLAFPGTLFCHDWEETASASQSGLVRLAQRSWGVAQDVLSRLLVPQPLMAGDRGVGGGMSGFDAFSPAVWGLPVQMERGMVDGGGNFVSWNDPVIGEVGTDFSPAVRVLDGGDTNCDPAVDAECHGPEPAADALVAFEVTSGGGNLDYTGVTRITDPFSGKDKVVTGADGIARVAWYPTDNNPNTATATGVGIGCSSFDADGDGNTDCQITNGSAPPSPVSSDGTGPFGDNDLVRQRIKVDLATGVIAFNAFACSAAPAFLAADGVINEGEYPELQSRTFRAKLSGGEVDATVYWTNDCNDLYVGVTVATSEEGENPPLRLVFDNNGDESEALGDDMLFLDRSSESVKGTKIYTWSFSDRFLSEDCLNDKAKSDCGDADPSSLQEGEGSFKFDPVSGGTYEFRHKLTDDDVDHDFQLKLGSPTESVTGFYLVFQTGQGPKGGMIFPGLEQYIPVTINP